MHIYVNKWHASNIIHSGYYFYKILHKHEFFLANNKQFNCNFNNMKRLRSMNASYSHANFMLDLWILKLHRKTILQQTPSSDTPTSGKPFFFFPPWYGGRLLEKKNKKKTPFIIHCWSSMYRLQLFQERIHISHTHQTRPHLIMEESMPLKNGLVEVTKQFSK